MAVPGGGGGGVDVARLERELAAALQAEQKYERENDAKFRAIHQKVGSYEEFRDIVKASHLSPLEHKDIAGGPFKQPWNTVAGGHITSVSDEMSQEEKERVKVPSTSQELVREWRRLRGSSSDRYRLLMLLRPEQVQSMVALDTGLMGELLMTLGEHCQSSNDSAQVITMLDAMSHTPRFALSIDFLNSHEKQSIQRLFSHLTHSQEHMGPDQQTMLTSLYLTYKLPDNNK